MGRALTRTFIARGIAAVGSVALALVIGRMYGPEGMGVYALAQSVLLGIGTLARQGMDNGLVRYVGQQHVSRNVPVYLRWALKRGLLLSVMAALAISFLRDPLEVLFKAEGLAKVLTGIAVAAPAYTCGFLYSGFFKAVRKPATAALLENGSIALLAGSFIVAWSMLGGKAELALIGYSYAIAAWLIAAQAGYQAYRWLKQQSFSPVTGGAAPDVPVSQSSFMATSRAFLVTNMARLMQTVLGVMAAGLVLSSVELGMFKAAQQISVLISFVLVVINAVFPPRFASLYYQGNLSGLGRLARQGALLGTVTATPFLLICLFWPVWVLGWFGEGFEQGAMLLRIIAVAQLINVATGSVGFLLNMTGHERLMRNIALVCNALGLLAFFLLPAWLGALGAACALAFILVTQNLTAMFFVWRRLGIWTLPGPNFLRWAGVRVR